MEKSLLAGKNVLVTGAARNIGRAVALEMGGAGASVFFTDIDHAGLRELESELRDRGIRSKGFLSDISIYEDIDRLCDALGAERIGIDILVNNVGVQFRNDTLSGFRIADWEKTYRVNVLGPMYLTKRIAGGMISEGIEGSVLFITSIHQWTVRTVASYSSSKAALGMIVKELALDLAPNGIRVNGIAPGWVAEDDHGSPLKHKYCPLYQTSIPPGYIGRAAVHLSSPFFSKHTTGTVIKIDGGLSLWNHTCEQKRAKTGI